jgi:hypothetical protein
MNSDELSLKLDELSKELQRMKDNLNTVQIAKHEREREIFELTESIRLAKHNIASKNLEIEQCQREYWRSRG